MSPHLGLGQNRLVRPSYHADVLSVSRSQDHFIVHCRIHPIDLSVVIHELSGPIKDRSKVGLQKPSTINNDFRTGRVLVLNRQLACIFHYTIMEFQ